MDNLIFCLNATMPIFLLMVIGVVLRRLNIITVSFANQMSSFVFTIALPILVFEDLATVNFKEAWNFKFVAFCFVATLLSILIVIIISYLLRDKESQGEFIQVSYRSSAALLGIAFINNIYGNSVMGPLMIIGSVPLYNIMAVVVLSFFKPEREKITKEVWLDTFKGIITNPIIIGIVVGLLWSIGQLPYPVILEKTVNYIGSTASPLGLIAMGACFEMKAAISKIKPTVIATFMKLFGFCMIFLPFAIMLGFVEDQLVAILIMLGSASTVACFTMAKNMGHSGTLTSNVVMTTTLMSGFSVTFWLYILRCLSLI